MVSDSFVALARSTQDGHVYHGHNVYLSSPRPLRLERTPERSHAPDEKLALPRLALPQVRQTHAALAIQVEGDWGYQVGVNEKGVSLSCTPIHLRLESGPTALEGSELVRLGLERAHVARQAVEILTELISKHGAESTALLIADPSEAVLLEVGGHHWALAEIGSLRVVTGVCMLRQDWDRISRGLAELTVERHWWSDDGRKLDFAGSLRLLGSSHADDVHRWGQSTLTLEQHSGHLDPPMLRRLLCHQAESLRRDDVAGCGSVLVRLSQSPYEPPVLWYAAEAHRPALYVPHLLDVDPPTIPDLCLRSEELLELQQRLDERLHEYLVEVAHLRQQGQLEESRRLASRMAQWLVERIEDNLPAAKPEEELLPTW